jgi:prepilin-type N-terminal cleavage/methylation domain-containing protein
MHTRRGFTLLEVMAAVVIASIVLVSILAVRTRSVEDSITASNERIAAILAQTLMEDALLGLEPDLQEDLPEGFDYAVSTFLESVGDENDVVMVTVEVDYPGTEGQKTILLSTYRLPFEDEEFEETF